ncbi:MAG: hypothetical protein K8W52_13505 [Deltaproteobacteria bacterium]|nr:hypothetical protein [Deltaproteobacteria bacterium]
MTSTVIRDAAVWRAASDAPDDIDGHARALDALAAREPALRAPLAAYQLARAAPIDHVWRLDPARDAHWSSVIAAAFVAGVELPIDHPRAAPALVHTLASLDDEPSVVALGRAVDRLAVRDPRVPPVVAAVLASRRASAAPVRLRAAWRAFEPPAPNGFHPALRAGLGRNDLAAVGLADRVLALAAPFDDSPDLALAFRVAGAHQLDRHLRQVREYVRRVIALADQPRAAALASRREIFAAAAIAFARLAPREAELVLRALIARQCSSRALHLDLIAGAVGGLVALAPRHAAVVQWTRRVRPAMPRTP